MNESCDCYKSLLLVLHMISDLVIRSSSGPSIQWIGKEGKVNNFDTRGSRSLDKFISVKLI